MFAVDSKIQTHCKRIAIVNLLLTHRSCTKWTLWREADFCYVASCVCTV